MRKLLSNNAEQEIALFHISRRVLVVSTATTLAAQAIFGKASKADELGDQTVSEYQLRIYKISASRMAEFIEGWRTNIVPSREQFGFQVVAAWTNIEKDEFVWILRWDGPEGYAAADRAYYDSPGRKSVLWDPAPFILGDELRILHQVSFQ